MNIYEASRDSVDDIIKLNFDGEYMEQKVFEYVLENYGCNCEIVSKLMHNKFQTFENYGNITVKCIYPDVGS